VSSDITGIAATAPLVVAVEGLCYAGKTTLIHKLAACCTATTLPDYADMAPLPPWPPPDSDAVQAALHHFLHLERRRAGHARASRTPVVLLDRSPLTLIAHECAMRGLGVPADVGGAADLFARAAAAGSILTPDAYIYLAVPESVTRRRRPDRGPVAAHLDSPEVRGWIEHTCQTWLATLPVERRLLLDGTAQVGRLAQRSAAFLATVGGTAPPSWRTLARALTVPAEARS
jgi:thymidylate kinase